METIKPDTNHLSSDPSDLSKLRYSQDFGAVVGVKKATHTVPVRKPDRQQFIRVREGDQYKFPACLIELKEDHETFLVHQDLYEFLPGDIVPKMLFTTINRLGTIALWPIKITGRDGKIDSWNRSALAAADLAQKSWVRLVANQNLGAYDIYEATANLPEPEWPDMSMEQLITIAFKDKIITSLDHHIIKKLKGEA